MKTAEATIERASVTHGIPLEGDSPQLGPGEFDGPRGARRPDCQAAVRAGPIRPPSPSVRALDLLCAAGTVRVSTSKFRERDLLTRKEVRKFLLFFKNAKENFSDFEGFQAQSGGSGSDHTEPSA